MAIISRASEKDLSRDEVRQFVAQVASSFAVQTKRVLIIIPDGTRTMPMPLMFELLEAEMATRAAACDYLVALGTHPRMSDQQLSRLLGKPVEDGRCGNARVFNHRWELPETVADVGTIPGAQVRGVSNDLRPESIRVNSNG